jgi:hypothetical protein
MLSKATRFDPFLIGHHQAKHNTRHKREIHQLPNLLGNETNFEKIPNISYITTNPKALQRRPTLKFSNCSFRSLCISQDPITVNSTSLFPTD